MKSYSFRFEVCNSVIWVVHNNQNYEILKENVKRLCLKEDVKYFTLLDNFLLDLNVCFKWKTKQNKNYNDIIVWLPSTRE